ncbi:MAG: iron ABC transporter permease [Acidimicrobiia bacterium]|nr:iron ABC transporter permease [Acidimicrobiia bacterium]
MTSERRWARLALAAVPVGFLAYFFVYPLVSILLTGFTDGGAGFDVLTRASTRSVVWFTLWQAIVSTIATVVIAMPGAYLLGRYDFRGKRAVKAAITVPFIMPTVVVGGAFLTLLGPSGPFGVDLRRTVWAILIAHVFFNYAVVVRTVSSAWERLDPELSAAATSLGASHTQVFRHITLPLLTPAIASAASIVFLFSFTSFGVVLILGDLVHSTVEVEIWRQATNLLNLGAAASLAVVQLIAISAVLVAYSRYQRARSVSGRVASIRATAITPATPRQKAVVAANLLLMAGLLVSPLAAIVIRAVSTGSGWGFDNFTSLVEPTSALFVPAIEAIRNSIWIAALATAIAVTIGTMTAWSIDRATTRFGQSLDVFIMLPLGTSAVTLGFGFLIALDTPIDLRTSFWILPIAHALIAIPFVVRTTLPVLRTIDDRLREAAAVLGASPSRIFRELDVPIARRALVVGSGFAFAVSMGEFGATSFLARPDTPTLPIAIYRLLTRPGSATFGQAMAAATVLMVVTAFGIFAVERWRSDTEQEF